MRAGAPRAGEAEARRAQRRLRAVFAALVVALLVIVGAGLAISAEINRNATEQYVERALPIRARVQSLELEVVNQQSAVRGFILTGEGATLDRFYRARGAVQADLRFLRREAAGDPELERLIAIAEPRIATLERHFDEQIERRRSGAIGAREARRLIAQRGEPLFESFRLTAAVMKARTDTAVREARLEQEALTRDLRRLLSLVGAAALALAIGLALVVPRRAGRLLGVIGADRAAIALSESRTRRLQDVTAAMARAPRVTDIVDIVLAQGRAATSASAGSVALLDDDGTTFRTVGVAGYAADVAADFGEYPESASLPLSDAVRNGPVWLHSREEVAARYPQLARFQDRNGHEAVAALPLLVDGRPIGGLALSFTGPRAFSADERPFLLTLADLCAQALDRARLYEAQAREAERTAFLADASTLLSSSLEPAETLAGLTRLAVPRLADWCAVSVPGPTGPETAAVAHTDPQKAELARALGERYPASADAPAGVPAVLRSGRSEHIPTVDEGVLRAVAQDEEHLAALQQLGLRSAVIVPLLARSGVLGALTLGNAESGRRFSADDVAFLEDLGRRAGLAMENARLFASEHHIAATLQRSLLPGRLPVIPGVEVATRYLAAGGSEVGGDFYDLFELEDGQGWAAVLGDVCGKGPEAASLTALARHTLRAESDLLAPAVVLSRLNLAVLRQRGDARFLTASYIWLRPRRGGLTGTMASGGHPPALILRRCGRVEELKPPGPLVGVFDAAHFFEEEFELGEGDALVLYSDGVIESRTPAPGRLFFGGGRLAELLSAHAGASAEHLAGAVETALEEFRQGGATDDVAMLVIRPSVAVEDAGRRGDGGVTARAGAADQAGGAPSRAA